MMASQIDVLKSLNLVFFQNRSDPPPPPVILELFGHFSKNTIFHQHLDLINPPRPFSTQNSKITKHLDCFDPPPLYGRNPN